MMNGNFVFLIEEILPYLEKRQHRKYCNAIKCFSLLIVLLFRDQSYGI